MLGCIQILLQDRFNEQVHIIYQKAIKYIVIEIGKEFDALPYLGPEDSSVENLLAKDNFNMQSLQFIQEKSDDKTNEAEDSSSQFLKNSLFKTMSLRYPKSHKTEKISNQQLN